MKTGNKRPLLTIQAVSEWLSIPEKTIRHYVYRRMIPFIKIGGQIRFREEDILELIESSTSNSQAQNIFGSLKSVNIGKRQHPRRRC